MVQKNHDDDNNNNDDDVKDDEGDRKDHRRRGKPRSDCVKSSQQTWILVLNPVPFEEMVYDENEDDELSMRIL